MAHNLEAEDVLDCDDCLEICTNPEERYPIRAFAQADQEHFKALLADPRYKGVDRDVMHVQHFKLPQLNTP